jgi:hypothetical protein
MRGGGTAWGTVVNVVDDIRGYETEGGRGHSPPVTIGFQFSRSSLQLNSSQGILPEADNVTGPWTTNSSAMAPFMISPTSQRKFYRVLVP